jgi:2-methylisocitrate lyase-like PEP mutase family enzyme
LNRPILLDGDTGYGNFNSIRRLARKLEQRGVAGVCVEDKIFPKTNSFIRGKSQPLAEVEEFCGKVRAGKDAQLDDDFVIVARVEALIAGLCISCYTTLDKAGVRLIAPLLYTYLAMAMTLVWLTPGTLRAVGWQGLMAE